MHLGRGEMSREVKIHFAGDGAVGKTCMIISHTEGKFPKEYLPSILEHYETIITKNEEELKFKIWDTGGEEGYARIRSLGYPGTSVFITVFSVVNRPSYVNINDRWIHEIRHHCPNTPILVVGNKTDLRNDSQTIYQLQKEGKTAITFEEGEELAKNIGAVAYCECSALTFEGLKNVFDHALQIGLQNIESRIK